MALERVGEILKMADGAHTSAIAFNCMDYSMIHSVVTAAEAANKPVIIMLYPNHAEDNRWCTPESFAADIPAPMDIMNGTVIGPVVTPPESKDSGRKEGSTKNASTNATA